MVEQRRKGGEERNLCIEYKTRFEIKGILYPEIITFLNSCTSSKLPLITTPASSLLVIIS